MIGGEEAYAEAIAEGLSASTEPPIVIGGELEYIMDMKSRVEAASTEPPIVIGGEIGRAVWRQVEDDPLQRSRRS